MAKILVNGNEIGVIGYSGGGGVENMELNLAPDVYIDGSGNEVSYNGWSATDFLDIDNSDVYIAYSYEANAYNAFYDSSKAFISTFSSTSGKLTIPVGAKYIRLSTETSRMADMYIFKEDN